jgi:DNA-binding TFAR19-related protein (PDSD5 family)
VWHYIKAAFLVGVDVPQLGRLPVNILLSAAFVILGVAEPAFWFVGLAVEAAIVASLAFNPRFQKYVQSQQLQVAKDDDELRRQQLIQLLEPEARRRLSALGLKCNRIVDVYRSQQAEGYIVDSNREALNRLEWNYLKLLVARHHLISAENSGSEQSLEEKVKDLELDLRDENQPEQLRDSKAATVAILKKRLSNIQRRSETMQEIDSDCMRVEAQVDLVLENATMQGKPQTISSDIELASDLLGAGIFGDDESAITDLDRKFAPAKTQQGSAS